jgi:hypothetical protein
LAQLLATTDVGWCYLSKVLHSGSEYLGSSRFFTRLLDLKVVAMEAWRTTGCGQHSKTWIWCLWYVSPRQIPREDEQGRPCPCGTRAQAQTGPAPASSGQIRSPRKLEKRRMSRYCSGKEDLWKQWRSLSPFLHGSHDGNHHHMLRPFKSWLCIRQASGFLVAMIRGARSRF